MNMRIGIILLGVLIFISTLRQFNNVQWKRMLVCYRPRRPLNNSSLVIIYLKQK